MLCLMAILVPGVNREVKEAHSLVKEREEIQQNGLSLFTFHFECFLKKLGHGPGTRKTSPQLQVVRRSLTKSQYFRLYQAQVPTTLGPTVILHARRCISANKTKWCGSIGSIGSIFNLQAVSRLRAWSFETHIESVEYWVVLASMVQANFHKNWLQFVMQSHLSTTL